MNGRQGFKKPLWMTTCSAEDLKATMDPAHKLLMHNNKRWSDNRKYLTGTSLTYADFHWLGFVTGCLDNPNGQNEVYKQAIKAELDKHEHVARINS